jgi:hypothetical protein
MEDFNNWNESNHFVTNLILVLPGFFSFYTYSTERIKMTQAGSTRVKQQNFSSAMCFDCKDLTDSNSDLRSYTVEPPILI